MSDNAKDVVLARIRVALADVAGAPDETLPIPWTFGQPRDIGDVIDVFIDRVRDYRATCERTPAGGLAEAVVAALRTHEVASVVLPAGLDETVVAAVENADVATSRDEPLLSRADLDATDAVVTGCTVASAETGTIMLNHGPGQGRRALTLVPDVHICIVRTDQVASDVGEAVARITPAVLERRPITWISGGSATSDIELSRVEGVHGPRTLHVIVVDA